MKFRSLQTILAAIALLACGTAMADFGVGVKAGTLGLGLEARWDPPVPWFDLRVGANSYDYNDKAGYGGEVEHLIKSLKVEGKPFDYEIFEDLPGGHSFDRMDTKIGKEIRLKIHFHLAKVLKPEKPFKSLRDLQIASYKFE